MLCEPIEYNRLRHIGDYTVKACVYVITIENPYSLVYGGCPGETDINLLRPLLQSGDRGKAKAGPTEDQADITDKASPLPLVSCSRTQSSEYVTPRAHARALYQKYAIPLSSPTLYLLYH